jgi:hypothetical protein
MSQSCLDELHPVSQCAPKVRAVVLARAVPVVAGARYRRSLRQILRSSRCGSDRGLRRNHYDRQATAERAAREEQERRLDEQHKAAEVQRLEAERRQHELKLAEGRRRSEEVKNIAARKQLEERARLEAEGLRCQSLKGKNRRTKRQLSWVDIRAGTGPANLSAFRQCG